MKPWSELRCLACRRSFGERLPGACRCQAEAIAAELTHLGEMSPRMRVSDVQLRTKRSCRAACQEDAANSLAAGEGYKWETEQCGMQRQCLALTQLPPGACTAPEPTGNCPVWWEVMQGSAAGAGKQKDTLLIQKPLQWAELCSSKLSILTPEKSHGCKPMALLQMSALRDVLPYLQSQPLSLSPRFQCKFLWRNCYSSSLHRKPMGMSTCAACSCSLQLLYHGLVFQSLMVSFLLMRRC